MQSVVAAAAVTIIIINKESLFLPDNCLLNISPVEAGSTAFPERGIFLTPLRYGMSGRCKAWSPCPADWQLRGNSFPGILLPWAALTRTAPARGREHRQPAAEGKSVTRPIDEDLFSPGF